MPVIERISDSDSNIFIPITIRMTNKRSLPVVMQYTAGNSDLVRSVRDVQKTIIVIFIMVQIAAQVDVIDPNGRSFLNTECVACFGENFGDDEVTNDDVFDFDDTESNAAES